MTDEVTVKPTVPEVIPLLREFVSQPGNSVGGNLHIVLDDGNVKDEDVQFCLERCREQRDQVGERLAAVLLHMSKTQRLKMGRLFADIAYRHA